MSLYHTYRPSDFSEIVGNEEIIESLEKMLSGESSHSFLFTGEKGCGKTTMGRILASKLGASGADYIEINSSQFRGIDTIRDIIKQSSYMPLNGTARVWLIDEAHKITNDAQNAFLKILEEPPKHIYFILCTTDPQKLIEPLKDRCTTFVVKSLNDKQMFKLLKRIARKENEVLDDKLLEVITDSSKGHPRAALQILEKVFSVPEDKRLKIAKKVEDDESQAIELCRAMFRNASWKEISSILRGIKDEDPEGVRRLILSYFSSVLLKQENDTAAAIMEVFSENFYNTGFSGLILACYTVIKGE